MRGSCRSAWLGKRTAAAAGTAAMAMSNLGREKGRLKEESDQQSVIPVVVAIFAAPPSLDSLGGNQEYERGRLPLDN